MLARVQSFAACVAAKSSIWTTRAVYYGKVGAQISKEIYIKEGLQPPAVHDFKKVYLNLYKKAMEYAVKPQQCITYVKAIQKNDALKLGAYGIQLLGFYSLGEIIGKRKIVGYRNYSTSH